MPPSHMYYCTVSAYPPPPSLVQNITVLDVEFLSNSSITIAVSWEEPTETNGRLDQYVICIGRKPIRQDGTCDETIIDVGYKISIFPIIVHVICSLFQGDTTIYNGNILVLTTSSDRFVYLQVRT